MSYVIGICLVRSSEWNRLVHRINTTQRLGKRGIKEPSDSVECEADRREGQGGQTTQNEWNGLSRVTFIQTWISSPCQTVDNPVEKMIYFYFTELDGNKREKNNDAFRNRACQGGNNRK